MQPSKFTALAPLIATIFLASCAGSMPSAGGAVGAAAAAPATPAAGASRDLTPPEKKVIVDAVATSVKDPAAAKYRWTKLATTPAEDGSYNYCATVDAQSPYPAYSGHQAYIVEVKLGFGGKVTSAVMGLIAGGKDFALVSKMCAKYGLDPNNAS